MKTPTFLSKLSAVLTPRTKKKLQATARSVPRAAMNDYDAEEPTTKLSSAFVVVLILHVVAVGGIYAFNSIKASRSSHAAVPAPVADKAKPGAMVETKTPAKMAKAPSATPARTAETANPIAPVPAVTTPKAGAGKQYSVRAGDNPTRIAEANGVKTADLLAANNLKEGTVLHAGQELTIPTSKPATVETRKSEIPAKPQTNVPPTRTTPGVHIVRKGETATSIAKNYGLSAEELLKTNRITDAKKIQLGQPLTIPKKKS